MDAAAAVFARRGPSGTKIADIAGAASMSQGLVYRYFPSKEHLFFALVVRALDGAVALAEEALRQPAPWEGLRWLGERMLAGVEHRPEGFLLVLHAFATEGLPEKTQHEALGRGERVRDIVRILVVEGQVTGEVTDGDPDELAGLFLACIQGLAAGAAFPQRWRPPLPRVDTLLRVLEPKG